MAIIAAPKPGATEKTCTRWRTVYGSRAAGSINAPLCYVSSLDNRLADHADRRYDARRENGRLGGRPKKNP
jgi:hypothetical protein